MARPRRQSTARESPENRCGEAQRGPSTQGGGGRNGAVGIFCGKMCILRLFWRDFLLSISFLLRGKNSMLRVLVWLLCSFLNTAVFNKICEIYIYIYNIYIGKP